MKMNADEIYCLAIDGHIYFINRYANLIYDEKGLPLRYEIPSLPAVKLIAKGFSLCELEEHPIRKAYFKLLAAKEHNIVEKQRPQDTTFEEVHDIVRKWFNENGFADEAEEWIAEYWN